MGVRVKRIYEPTERGDGFRVLVDRVWPRGVRKEDADIDLRAKGRPERASRSSSKTERASRSSGKH